MTRTTQRSALTRNTAIANSLRAYFYLNSGRYIRLQLRCTPSAVSHYRHSHYSTRIRSVQMSVIACTDSAEITKRTPAVYKLLYTNTKSWFRFICCFASFHFIRAGDKDLTAENRRHTDTHTKDHIKIYSAIFQFIVAQSGEMKATTNNSL